MKTEGYTGITDPKEVGGLNRAIRGYAGEPSTCTGLLLLAYTFLRPGEVGKLQWTDVDWDKGQILFPEDRMKMPRVYVVPMSRQVVDFLREIQRLTGCSEWVLKSWNKSRPLSNNTLKTALRRLGYTKAQTLQSPQGSPW